MISVVIPVLNNYNLIDQLFSSILNNTVHPSEIILIDNNSSQNIIELINKYDLLNIVYIRHYKNIGVNAAWNLGRKISKFKYVVILNNDVVLNSRFFECIIDVMSADRTIGICFPDTCVSLNELESDKNIILKYEVFEKNGHSFVLRKDVSDIIGDIPKELFNFFGDDYLMSNIAKLNFKSALIKNNKVYYHNYKTIYYWKSEQLVLADYYKENHLFEKIKKQMNLPSFSKTSYNYFNGENLKCLLDLYKTNEMIDLLIEIFKLFNFNTYVELGTGDGFTFNKLSPLVKRAIGVDIKLTNNIKDLKNVELYQMSTIDFSEIWNDPIDFLFIDADHNKENVLNDFNLFSKYVKEGTGIIAIHDTHPIRSELLGMSFCHNSYEAAWEIRNNPEYRKNFEIFTFPGPFAGLSLIRKSEKQLSWA